MRFASPGERLACMGKGACYERDATGERQWERLDSQWRREQGREEGGVGT